MQLVFEWTVEQFSSFKTFQSAFQVLAMLVCVPVMSELFEWPDTVIIMFGTLAHSVARIFFITADAAWKFFIGKLKNY